MGGPVVRVPADPETSDGFLQCSYELAAVTPERGIASIDIDYRTVGGRDEEATRASLPTQRTVSGSQETGYRSLPGVPNAFANVDRALNGAIFGFQGVVLQGDGFALVVGSWDRLYEPTAFRSPDPNAVVPFVAGFVRYIARYRLSS